MNKAFFLLALLPLTFALAADLPKNSPPMKRVDNKDVPIEELAHSFFYHTSRAPEALTGLISRQGVSALQPALAEHKREMNDPRRIVAKARQLCTDLQRARTGAEFAVTLTEWEAKERAHSRYAATQILSMLDEYDRMALEEYLDTEYRRTGSYTRLDYEAMFASGPFPSDQSDTLKQRLCNDAAEFQGKGAP